MKKNKKNIGLALALAVTFATTFQTVANINIYPTPLGNEGVFPSTASKSEGWNKATENFKISMSDDIAGFEAVGDPFINMGREAYAPLPIKDGVAFCPFSLMVTTPGFHSWKGKIVTGDGGAYGTAEFIEFGGRLHFSAHITAPEGMWFSLKGIKFHFKSPDGYYDEFISFPLVFNSTRVGVGLDGTVYNNPTQTGLEEVKLRDFRYIGIGIGLQAFGDGSNQQKIQNTLAYMMQSGFSLTCTTTVQVFRISDNTSGTSMSDVMTVKFEDCPSEASLADARLKVRFKKVGDEARFIIRSHKMAYYRIMRSINEPSTPEEMLTSDTATDAGAIIFSTEHPNAEIRLPGFAGGTNRIYFLQSAPLCDPISRIVGGRIIRDQMEDLTQDQILGEYLRLDLKGKVPEKAPLAT